MSKILTQIYESTPNLSFLDISLNNSLQSAIESNDDESNKTRSGLGRNVQSSIIFKSNLEFLDISWNNSVQLEIFSAAESSSTSELEPSSISKVESPTNQLTKKLVSHSLKFNESYRSLEALSKIVNETPGAKYQIPKTTYRIKKLMDPLVETEYHIQCKACKKYSATLSNKAMCEKCMLQLNRANSRYFVYFPFTAQLKQSIIKHFETIISYSASSDENSDLITDIQCAAQFKISKKKYSKFFLLSLTINTDGVQIYNSTKKSVWPIQLHLNYLPPTIRYHPKNVIVVALHDGKPKNMSEFFYPFLKELRQIHEIGGLDMDKNGQQYKFLPIITSCTADLPAKNDVQGMIGHRGYYGCSYCLHPGELIKKDKNSRAVVRYVAKDCQIRTHSDTLSTYMKLRSEPINGVKSISCLIAASDFDLINGFSIDYLHCVLLGVTKLLMNLWLDSENHSKLFHISNKRQAVLSSRIISIKPITEITRKPRSVTERKDYKGNEFRTLLLYYLRFCLVDLLPTCYIDHFQLLSSAIYTLLKEKMSPEDIANAERKLMHFADTFEKLYGKEHVTMNVHLLRHLANSVRNLGPLWVQSAFTFERNNGFIVSANHATKDFLQNLSWKYTVNATLKNDREEKIDHDIHVGGKVNIPLSMEECSNLSEEGLEVENNNLTPYTSVSFNNTKITSLIYKTISTADFFVELSTTEIGAVKYFIVQNYNVYAFINIHGVKNKYDHLLEIEPIGKNKVFNVKEISKKMLYMKIGKYEIVTSIPNKYEQS